MGDNFNALNAKIGVLKKGILHQEDYENLLSFAKREEIIDYLKDNPIYKKQIEIYLEDTLRHRYATEFMIQKSEIDLFEKLKHFLFGEDKLLIEAMLVRYEFEDIKIILRSIVEQQVIDKNKDLLMYRISKNINYDKLLKQETLHQAIDCLLDTNYKRAFLSIKDEDELRLHFHVEMNLDSYCFSLLKNVAKKFSRVNRQIIDDFYSTLTDTMNIQWIIRAKKYYNLSNEEIYSYALRFGKKVKGQLLKDLVYSANEAEVLEKIKNTEYGALFNENQQKMLSYRDAQGYVYKKELSKLKNYDNTISTFFKFMINVLIQSKNIIRIAETQKYSLSKDEARKYLIETK